MQILRKDEVLGSSPRVGSNAYGGSPVRTGVCKTLAIWTIRFDSVRRHQYSRSSAVRTLVLHTRSQGFESLREYQSEYGVGVAHVVWGHETRVRVLLL